MNDLSFERLKAIASNFIRRDALGNASNDKLGRIHARKGVLAASDGRILIHVESPVITPVEMSAESVLDFTADGFKVIAGKRLIESVVVPLACFAYVKGATRATKIRERASLELQRARRRICPHCGEDIIESDCGAFVTPDEFLEERLTEAEEVMGHATIHFGPHAASVGIKHLHTALEAASALGGAEILEAAPVDDNRSRIQMLRLRGEGWFIVIVTSRFNLDPDLETGIYLDTDPFL